MKKLHALFILVCNVGLVPSEDADGQEIQTHIERLHEKLLSADVYDKTLRPLPTSNKTTATLVEASFPHRHIVSVSPYTRFKVPCPMDLTDFPKDEHTCKVRFTSTVYSDDMQQYDTVDDLVENAMTPSADVTGMMFNSLFRTLKPWQDHQWEVTVLPMWGSGSFLNRTYLELTFRLRRRSSGYFFSVTLPWISSVVLLLLVFWLPANSSRRLTLCCINMLLLALMLRRMVPLLGGSYRPPKIIFFLEGAMVLQAVVTAIAVACLNVTSEHMVFPVAVPPSLIHFLTGSAGIALCLRHHDLTRHGAAHTAPPARAGEHSQHPVTRLSQERAREWLLVAHAVDRLFIVVFLVAAVCVMPL
ncbi:hypothetical protein HPB50_011026 [Hyalomma asiaticum]|uniref:Uncharacterized protein n=1 Tax=Hyalomma asiaticum TaxID=266040 RepID=A0ACB7RIW3_HYAAI|nr:hypothetical protein HPB50_011026 [Hyalomma asiaticum]